MYSDRILNNSHRGDVVEAMVLAALSEEWQFVGLGWNAWDIQRGAEAERIRIQVKQCGALQVWGPTKRQVIDFGWKNAPPSYFKKDFPDVPIESEGFFCDLFVIGVHLENDPVKADQVDVRQWKFLVIPKGAVEQKSMTVARAMEIWPGIGWTNLGSAIEKASEEICEKGLNLIDEI